MKTVYILIAVLILVGGGIFAYISFNGGEEDIVPEGYHRMEDGTLMRNDMGMEGMGALEEIRNNQAEMEMEDKSSSMAIDPNAQVFEVRGVNYSYDVKEIRVKKR